ncbi:hypothetical protein JW962_00305 [Candidatus Dojkabacteria bacterium]|nr:hypothetical protein [Candidatus Dojkabacteria bacterium]
MATNMIQNVSEPTRKRISAVLSNTALKPDTINNLPNDIMDLAQQKISSTQAFVIRDVVDPRVASDRYANFENAIKVTATELDTALKTQPQDKDKTAQVVSELVGQLANMAYYAEKASPLNKVT